MFVLGVNVVPVTHVGASGACLSVPCQAELSRAVSTALAELVSSGVKVTSSGVPNGNVRCNRRIKGLFF